MHPYSKKPISILKKGTSEIAFFLEDKKNENIDWQTVESFGAEWTKFSAFTDQEITEIGNQYFDIVDFNIINKKSYVLDMGCGTGRWTKYLADKVGFIEAIDPSVSVFKASELLKNNTNVRVSQASVDLIPFEDNSFDLVFSLGVLHHIPDTKKAMKNCINKVKPGGYFLVYLYYNFDNRGYLFKTIFQISNLIRKVVSKLPYSIKSLVCDFFAIIFYMPFVLLCRMMDRINFTRKFIKYIPLSFYRRTTFNVIRNDALDRFGTPLEQRFSKKDIQRMMEDCGLGQIHFSNEEPFWHAIGKKI
jgi:SAM-dependent methyltransferase